MTKLSTTTFSMVFIHKKDVIDDISTDKNVIVGDFSIQKDFLYDEKLIVDDFSIERS